MQLKLWKKLSFKDVIKIAFRLSVSSSISATLLVSGCTMVGPDFVKPEAPVGREWLEAREAAIKTEASDYKDWWTVFNDPVLNSLVETAYMIGGAKRIPKTPPTIVVDIPAELLRRRPDIRLAEYQIATQTPLIGVSKADLFPAFELFGSFGLLTSTSKNTKSGGQNGSSFSDLFEADSFEFFGGPSLRWNLFNYGRIRNRVRVEDAVLQQLIVNYEDTVLRAHQEVEDSMIGFLKKQQEAEFLNDSVKAAQRSVELSTFQYKEGMVDYQRVLDSQRFLSDQQDVMIFS